jgi:hypothetical protein
VGYFCPPGTGSGIRIRIRIRWPDWIRIQYKSGSATLVSVLITFIIYGYELFEIVFDYLIIGLWGYCPSCEKIIKIWKRTFLKKLSLIFLKNYPKLQFQRPDPERIPNPGVGSGSSNAIQYGSILGCLIITLFLQFWWVRRFFPFPHAHWVQI